MPFRFAAIMLMLLLVAACGSNPVEETGPRLVGNNQLEATTPAPTRNLSATPDMTRLANAPTSEVLSPLENITVEADFVLVTPTLPPTKTPTETPTITYTPTLSPTPTVTVTATATQPVFPTSIIIPITAVVAAPIDEICDSTWFFIEPRPANCPLAPPTASQGVYQSFENGYMIWTGVTDSIYVFYSDETQPRWQVYRDFFEEDMEHESEDYAIPPRPGVWQPRRGFGLLWRTNEYVRDRIGWGNIEWEIPYSVNTQTAGDGVLFMDDPDGNVFGLLPGGRDWARYEGYAGF